MAEDVDDTQHDSQMLTQDESRFESGDVGVGADGGDVADNQSDAEGSGSQADGTDEEDEVDDDATTEENDDDEVAMDDDGDEDDDDDATTEEDEEEDDEDEDEEDD